MRLSYIVLVSFILLNSTVFAVDCSQQKTKEACSDPTCKYTPANTCVTKCTGLDRTQCTAAGEATDSCDASVQECKLNFNNCNTANNKSDCIKLDNSCSYTEAVLETCTTLDAIQQECANIGDNSVNCGDNPNCVYVQPTYLKCIDNINFCANQCELPRCLYQGSACIGAGMCDRIELQNDKDQCNAAKGCIYAENAALCYDHPDCDNAVDDCTLSQCKQKPEGCNLKPYDYTCYEKENINDCKSDLSCEVVTNPGFCKAKDDLCKLDSCDTQKCNKVGAKPSKCNNADCPNDFTNCGPYCTATQFSCTQKANKLCQSNPATAAECTGFCLFSEQGTCAANPDNNSNNNNNNNNNTKATILVLSGLLSIIFII